MERIIKQSIACIAQNVNAGLDETARAAGVGRRNRMPTIMGGRLLVATALTLVVMPMFYSLFFRISRGEMRF